MPPLSASRKWALAASPFAAVAIALTLAAFARLIPGYLRIRYGVWFELGMVIGQILFQSIFIRKRPAADKLDYAIILIGVSLFGAALLWPLLVIAPSAPTAGLCFLGVAGMMFGVHWWAAHRRGLPTRLCFTWMLYRLLILAGVFRFEVLLPR